MWISVSSYLTSDLSRPSPPAVRDDSGCDGDRHWRPVPAVVALHPVSVTLTHAPFFLSLTFGV